MQQSAQAIYDELQRRGFRVDILNRKRGLLSFHDGSRQRFIHSVKPDMSSATGVMLGEDKELTMNIAIRQRMQVPESVIDPQAEELDNFLMHYAPIVVKPTDGAHGNGVVMNIRDTVALEEACVFARTKSARQSITIQQEVKGDDLRLLVVGDRMVAAVARRPAHVVGDGTRTIRQLISLENEENPDRAANYTARLNYIDIVAAEMFLGKSIDTIVPELDQETRVVGPANIGKGGTAIDVTDRIPDMIIAQAVKISQTLGLAVCGVDFIACDIREVSSYYFIEVNACPSLGLHLYPAVGESRPVVADIVDYLLQ